MDKLTLKRLLPGQGIPQVDFVAVGEEGWRERCAELGTPLWVKPSRMGSSVGISRIEDLTALDGAVATALRHDPRVIVEASAHGREIECSVLGNEDPRTSMPGEILAHAEWYDYEAKYEEGGMDLAVPAPISEIETARGRRLPRDQRLREAARGGRDLLPGPLRPPRRAGDRAPPERAVLRVLSGAPAP